MQLDMVTLCHVEPGNVEASYPFAGMPALRSRAAKPITELFSTETAGAVAETAGDVALDDMFACLLVVGITEVTDLEP
jgi:hypothetical protein